MLAVTRLLRPLTIVLLLMLSLSPLHAQTSLYDFKVKSLEGKTVDLSIYKGHVVLVVNVASFCGFTPQYAGLEKLYTQYKDAGFFVLGFPANDFGHQEPGSPEEIAHFCHSTYNVTFPMFEKVSTIGSSKAPLYQFLTTGFPEPTWNFCKYLVGKDGKVIKEFPSDVTPESDELNNAIKATLSK